MTTHDVRARGLRIVALLWAMLAGFAAPSLAADAISLDDGFVVRHDGSGGLRLESGERTVLDLSLLWIDGDAVRPLTHAEGVVGAKSGDESRARIVGTPAELHARVRHWNWFHVDPILFVDAALHTETPDAGAPGLRIATEGPWQKRRVTVQPHLAAGRAPIVNVEVVETVVDLDGFDRRHVGIVRLDRRASIDGDDLRWNDEAITWPLAVIVARSRTSLEHLVGQALVTYDDVGRAKEPTWRIPPMCGHCRTPEIEELRLDVTWKDRALHVLADARGPHRLHAIDWPALRLEDVPMNLFHRGERDGRIVYEIPAASPAALIVAEALDEGSLDAAVVSCTGQEHRPDATFADAPTSLAERVRAESPIDLEEDLPSYLSPRLVTNWPNPFLDQTTIQVIVPATLREAFEMDAGLQARIPVDMAPPFGETPTVRVKVYNVSGQLVKVLDERVREAGSFVVSWEGDDVQGQAVAAGAYYVNVEMGDWSVTKRVLRVRG